MLAMLCPSKSLSAQYNKMTLRVQLLNVESWVDLQVKEEEKRSLMGRNLGLTVVVVTNQRKIFSTKVCWRQQKAPRRESASEPSSSSPHQLRRPSRMDQREWSPSTLPLRNHP